MKIFLFLIGLFFLSTGKAVECDNGVQFTDTFTVVNSDREPVDLGLIGVGLREEFFFDVFFGALYLSKEGLSSKEIIESEDVKTVVIKPIRTLSRQLLVSQAKDEFERLCDGQCQELQQPHSEFLSYAMTLEPGDTITMIFWSNGFQFQAGQSNPYHFLASRSYGQLLLRSMIGDRPNNEKFKSGIIGKTQICQ